MSVQNLVMAEPTRKLLGTKAQGFLHTKLQEKDNETVDKVPNDAADREGFPWQKWRPLSAHLDRTERQREQHARLQDRFQPKLIQQYNETFARIPVEIVRPHLRNKKADRMCT